MHEDLLFIVITLHIVFWNEDFSFKKYFVMVYNIIIIVSMNEWM